MSIKATDNRTQHSSSYQIPEEALDPLTGKPMTEAVSLSGCGHVVNEDTAQRIMHITCRCTLGCGHVAGHEPFVDAETVQKFREFSTRCTLDSGQSAGYERFVTKNIAQKMPQATGCCPFDGKELKGYAPCYRIRNLAKNVAEPKEAVRWFNLGKEAMRRGDTQEAKVWFSNALEIYPEYERAAAYLEHCTTGYQKVLQGIRAHLTDVEGAILPPNPRLGFFSTEQRTV